ncbi:hypothetical protein DAI22_01g062408 [Oryza sativa Japonica Group]|nr:hypothetical protein DAI22_01g062408 [Oryza sativa Japonica Group]
MILSIVTDSARGKRSYGHRSINISIAPLGEQRTDMTDEQKLPRRANLPSTHVHVVVAPPLTPREVTVAPLSCVPASCCGCAQRDRSIDRSTAG